MRKRGQVAAFIIIGLVILLAVIGVVLVKKGILSELFKKISVETTAIPQQIKPIEESLNSCTYQITAKGIDLLAQQGGYIDLPTDPIPTTTFNPIGSTLEIIPTSDFRTAVWFRETGNGIQTSNIPSKGSMENNLEDYVTNNFLNCINNLTTFSEQGFEISIDATPKTKVEITNRKVSTEIALPIKVKIQNTEFTLSKHKAIVDSNLGTLYLMAKEIMEKENEEQFLEKRTMDMLVAYDEEVPFSGTDLSCTEKIWLKSDVDLKLKNIIFENIASLRVKGTNYNAGNNLKNLEIDALKTKDKAVTANLMYLPEWPTLIEINPSEGNILRSNSLIKKTGNLGALISSFFCINTYRFVYDIKYPVLITLADNNGLIFQFATQVIVDNNQPRENKLETLDIAETESPICQYPQREAKIFTATINEKEELVPLDGVDISFKCFPTSCPIGESELNAEGEAILESQVPLCVNGAIEGYKDGYKQVQKTYFSSNDESQPSVNLVLLEKIYKKKINLVVIDKDTGEERPPYETEQINFQFANKQTSYETTYLYQPGELAQDSIDLIPGEYIINSYVMRKASTYKPTFPKQVIENCIDTRDFGLFGFFKNKQVCSSTETEQVEFDSVLTGGAANVEYEFTRQELADEKPLTLYVLTSKIPSNLEELQNIQIELETNKDHPLFRYPEVR